MELCPDGRYKFLRLQAAKLRLRDPLPSAEFERESKKLRIVCEFHAKGWCIKGKSCRFLHIKDGPDAVMMKSEALGREGNLYTFFVARHLTQVCWEVCLSFVFIRSYKPTNFLSFVAVAASSSACIPPLQRGENPKLNSEMEKLVFPEDDTYIGDPTREDRWSFRHNLYLDNYWNYGSPPVRGILSARDCAYHGSSSITSHDHDCDNRASFFGPTMDEIISKKTNIVQCDPRFADWPDSYTRHPLPFCSSSQNSNAHGVHKFFKGNLEHHAYASSSMQRSIPLPSHSESDTLSRNHIFREAEPAELEATFPSFDWEPSAPFHPSHEITRSILLKECGYNQMHDSTDKKDVKDIRTRFSHSDQGSSIKNVNVQSSGPQAEEKLVIAGDSVKDNILSSSNDDEVKHGRIMDGTALEVDGSGTKDDIDADFKQDDHVQSESKAFKYFQSALIESVKELVKPSWREGFLSKDAHKLIVKKAVDKVRRTLPIHQIPSTPESVKSYLSSSQPKLAKLVEVSPFTKLMDKYLSQNLLLIEIILDIRSLLSLQGYINIYGKT